MELTVPINDIPDISCFIYRLFNYIEKLNSSKNRMHIIFGKQFTIYNFFLMLIQLSCYEEDIPKDLKIMEHNKHEDNYLHHLTCDIVVAYLSGNAIPFSDVPLLIQQIYRALAGVEMDVSDDKELVPAVPIKKSVFPDYIICLEDGKKVKMLKRHLMSAFGLTPSAYRKKWGLPANYPMVAPAYSEQRSRLARSSGLGNNKSQEITELQQEKSEEDAIVTRLPEVKRGRKKKLG